MPDETTAPQLEFVKEADATTVLLSGDWSIERGIPATGDLTASLAGVERLRFDSTELGAWDSSLLSVLGRLAKACDVDRIEVDAEGLPPGIRSLIRISRAVPPKETSRKREKPSFLATTGEASIALATDLRSIVTFFGESILLLGRFLGRRARYQRRDLTLYVQEAGADALPVVTVINFLVGLILAFIGAQQLQRFGAGIYVADLVGVGMTREMAPLMTAIIMSGRTGAAYAAQLGTMIVNEEVDALSTFGIPPLDFLVLPRMLALMLMMPLLALYGMALGIAAGALAAGGALDIGLTEYVTQLQSAVGLVEIAIGLLKASIFGVIVALAGCLRGMQSGRNAAAVGKAATSAVVTSIVLIIVADAAINIVLQLLGM